MKTTYEDVYEIIKKYGPVDINDIGKILINRKVTTEEDFKLCDYTIISAHLSNLSQNNHIEKINAPDNSIRKKPDYFKWMIKSKS